ncbi:hypothetical protein J7L87_06350, partial [bacterium]|nr:hypothetical protein [bacterium]
SGGSFHPIDLGDSFYYKTSIGPNWSFINEGLNEGIIPEEIPIFGKKAFNIHFIPTLEGEVRSNYASFKLLEEGLRQGGEIAGFGIEITPYVGINGTYILPAGYWDWDGEIGLKSNFSTEATFPFLLGPIPMYAAVTLKLNLDADLDIKDIEPIILNGNFIVGPYVRGSLGAGINHLLAVEGYLGGGADAYLQFPEEPHFKQLIIYINGGFTIYALLWKYENELFEKEWSWPENKLEEGKKLSSGKPVLVERDYIKKPGYGKFTGGKNGEIKLLKTGKQTYVIKTAPLQENVYPRSEPSIFSCGNYTYLTWIYDNPERSSTNRTEVVFSSFDGNTWSEPEVIDDDGTADFHPDLITFSDGSAICAWENVKIVLPEDAELNNALTNLEIKTATYNPDTNLWNTFILTDNGYLDRSPQMSGKEENNVMLVWLSNEENDIYGSSEKPNRVWYSVFNGANWTLPQLVTQIPYPTFGYDFAFDGNKGYLVFSLDTDDNIQTDTDRELYCLTFENNTWGELTRLTNDQLIDSNPKLAFDQNGNLILVWLKQNGLYSVKNLDMENAQIIKSVEYTTNLADFKLANSPDGKLAIIWSKPSQYSADVWTIFYDPIFNVWGNPQKITDDQEVERWLTPCFYGNNTLMVVYNRTTIEEKSELKTLENGMKIKYVSPEPISTDLYFLMMNLGEDIALKSDSFLVDPENPSPGENATFSVSVINLGNVAVNSIPVVFYKGNPEEGGEEIGRVSTDGVISPGEEKTVSFSWDISAPVYPVDIYAVVDPDNTLSGDSNRINNISHITIVKPDLVIENVTTEKIVNEIIISPKITNFGTTSSGETTLRMRKNSSDGEILY